MNKISQQLSDFRKTTPKYIQWLLLLAAIVSVVILIVLLMEQKKTKIINAQRPNVPDIISEISISPETSIDWSNTSVGDVRAEQLIISTNKRIQITDIVVRSDDISEYPVGITVDETCTRSVIEPGTSCVINLDYRPIEAIPLADVNIAIMWHDIDTGTEHEKPEAVRILISAIQEIEMDPIEEPEPIVEPEPVYSPEPVGGIIDDDLLPPIDFEPRPIYDVKPVARLGVVSTGCSDFAFPGYNTTGIQSGWIKPVGGGYYYYHFSDVNCENPVGIYNPDSGIIVDISNPTHKIGSDAEHIRFIMANNMPNLTSKSERRVGNRAEQLTLNAPNSPSLQVVSSLPSSTRSSANTKFRIDLKPAKKSREEFKGYSNSPGVVSTRPYDRSFVLRQYKPIPATIVSDVQADAKLLGSGLPVRATVDRNVYSDNGRTVIIPTGTLMLGRVVGDLPGPYKAVGRMQIEWYQFIRPDGVEFNFIDDKPFAADAQGRKGVPGHGNTDYLQQFIMPMLTAIVPAAVNMIAPISDAFVNQIDLDNNTVVQSGTVRSSEMAKNEIITAWNNVATKLMVDMMDNTTPPFSIAAGTRITVFSPVDLFVTCGFDDTSRACAIRPYPSDTEVKRDQPEKDASGIEKYSEKWYAEKEKNRDVEELIGQARSMMMGGYFDKWCVSSPNDKNSKQATTDKDIIAQMNDKGYSFATVDFYCRSFGTYQAINNARQEAVYENQKENAKNVQKGTQEYNTQVLGLTYSDDGTTIQNPFKSEKKESAPAAASASSSSTSVITCDGGVNPDANGCCPGETYTDMGDQGYNCCPDAGGDCFPPIQM